MGMLRFQAEKEFAEKYTTVKNKHAVENKIQKFSKAIGIICFSL